VSDDVINVSVVNGLEEAPADGTTYGRKDAAWVDITSPATLQVRRGTEAERVAVTPDVAEPVYATDSKRLYMGDGQTVGGLLVGPQTFAAVNTTSNELVRTTATNTLTPDTNATVTLGAAGAYLVKVYMFFQAENESEEGDPGLTLKIRLPTSGFSYIYGASSAEETVTGITDSPGHEYTKDFVCVTSGAGAVLVPSWYVSAGSDGMIRGAYSVIAIKV
jgi:hypothetical protein